MKTATWIIRAWILACAGWIAYQLWRYNADCHPLKLRAGRFNGAALSCNVQTADGSVIGHTAPLLPMLGQMVEQSFAAPLCGIIIGILLYVMVIRPQTRAGVAPRR